MTAENLTLLHSINTGQYAPPPLPQTSFNRTSLSAAPQEDPPDPEQEKYKKRDELIGKVENGINIAAKVIGYLSPKAGENIKKIGATVVDVARNVNNFVNTARQIINNPLVKSLAGNLLKFGAPLLAGGLIGAAFTAFSMFGGGGGSGPDPVILMQLELIRKQIDQLRTEMHDRFDQVDKKLNAIFDAVEFGFRNLTGDLDATRENLIVLNANLNRFESDVYGWFDDISRRDLKETINLAIGYKERTGLDMPPSDFDRYSNKFYTYATDFSKGEIAAGPRTRDYSDAKAFDELDKFPLEVNANYLAQFSSKNLGLTALSNSVIANARYWTVSTDADTRLRIESPTLDKQIPTTSRRKEIYDAGKQIQSAIEAVTILNTNNGPKANRPLFDALLAKYNTKANALSLAIKKVEDDYKNDPANAVIKDVNLWGDATQAASYIFPVPGEPRQCANNSNDAQMRAPSNSIRIDQAMPNPVRLAAKLGVWQVQYCFSFDWGRETVGPTNNLTIRLAAGNQIVGQPGDSEWLAALSLGGLGPITAHDAVALNKAWNEGWKGRFEQNATLIKLYSNAQVEAATNAANTALGNYRRASLSKVLDELSRASEVQFAARELSGAKKLLESYVALGLSRSLEENDTLRSLLYGDQQVPDENDIKATYAAAVQTLQDSKPTQRVETLTLTTPRINALAEVLHSVLDELARFRLNYPQDALFYSNPEALLSVDNTLQEMEVHNPTATLGKVTVAHSQAITTPVNQAQGLTLTGFDSDGAPLRYAVVGTPKRGRVTGQAPYLVYTPDRDYVGRDSFTFKVIGATESNPATVSINVAGVLCASQSFHSSVINDRLGEPYSSVARDFNRDGKPDVAVTDAKNNNVTVMLGDGAGTFTTPTTFAVGTNPLVLAAEDFNRDGKLDLAVANYKSNNISILLGNGVGGFGTAVSIAVGTGPREIAAADFNLDGKPDLIVSNRDSKNVSLLLGNGDGTFKTATNINLGGIAGEVEAADFNHDGKPDVAVALNDAGSVVVLIGKGDGQFEAAATYTVDAFPTSIALGDFNEDGEVDLAVGNQGGKKVSILLGDGFGRFRAALNFDAGIPGFAVAVGDFNQDAHADLIVAGYDANSVAVLLGDGLGGFVTATVYSAGKTVTDVVVGDFNSDQRADVVVVNNGSPNITILSSACAAVPTVASVSAASYQSQLFAPESITAAFGSDLAGETRVATVVPLPTALGGITVTVKDSFGTERLAPLFFVSPTQLNYIIPAGTASGSAVVKVTKYNNAAISGDVRVSPVAPGLFSASASGQGVASALALRVAAGGAQTYEEIARFDPGRNQFVSVPINLGPATDQVFLVLYGTGIRYRSSLSAVTARVGGSPVDVLYAGEVAGLAGLDQINLTLPRTLAGRGEVDIVLSVDGVSANTVRVSIK